MKSLKWFVFVSVLVLQINDIRYDIFEMVRLVSCLDYVSPPEFITSSS